MDVVSQGFVHVINDNPRSWLSVMHFEEEFCFDCDWRRVDLNASDKVSLPLSFFRWQPHYYQALHA